MKINIVDAVTAISSKCDCFYLYSESSILERTAKLKTELPSVDFLYSIKCNHNPTVAETVFLQGFGADAASLGEVRIAFEHGVSPGDIYYSAPGKSYEDIEGAWGKANLIADSLNEIELIERIAASKGGEINIGVRINPDTAFDGGRQIPSKFGIDEEQLINFLPLRNCPHVHITGIHVHLRSQELNAGVIAKYYGNVLDLTSRVEETVGCELEYINLGSGIGIPYAETDEEVELGILSETLRRMSAERKTRILIEVGRYAVCKSGYYATRVMDRKVSKGKTYIILKNALNGFLRPSIAKFVENYACNDILPGCEPLYTGRDSFSFIAVNKSDAPNEEVCLVGNLCTAADVIAENVRMPHLEPGDMIMINNAGAYAAVLSPMQFSSQEKPEEYFLRTDGNIEKV